MSKQLTEKDVLKMLNIPDFRHMSKDKIMKFTSALPDMSPEVAKEALRQFPQFAATAKGIIDCYRDAMLETMKGDQENVKSFNDSCDVLIDLLADMAKQDDLTFEQKNEVIDKIMDVIKLKGAKDSETKKFRYALIGALGAASIAVAFILGATLGGNSEVRGSGDDDGADE